MNGTAILKALVALSMLSLSACGGSGGGDGMTGPATPAGASSPRIVNGVPIEPDSLPYVKQMLSVGFDGSVRTCSGSFISPNHFLTAAHCLMADESGALPPDRYLVEISPGEFVNGVGLAVNPGYTGSAADSADADDLRYWPNDIGILLVSAPYDGPTPPLSTRLPMAGQLSIIAGYGLTATDGTPDGTLRAGLVPIELVSATDGSIYWFIGEGEANTCFGDSGGPMLLQFAENEPLVLVGVTSSGAPNCESGYSANVLVPSQLEFINLITGGMQTSL